MIKRLELKDLETAKSIIELQRASYVIEARLIGYYDIPPLKETIDSLQSSEETFYGYYIKGILAGIISFKINDNILDIHRVAIHPDFFRRGIGNRLIKFVEENNSNVDKIVVCTGKENIPAINLYLKNGYRKKRDIEIQRGIFITELEKVLK